jgi:hypothetical protein
MPRKSTKKDQETNKTAVLEPPNDAETLETLEATPLEADESGQLTLQERIMAGKRPAILTPPDFKELLSAYTQQSGLKIYVWRQVPKIDLKLIGLKHRNLQVRYASQGFPEDIALWLTSLYGGGEYKLQLNDGNLQFCGIAQVFVTVPMDQFEPILDVGSLVRGDPGNEQLIQRWKLEGKCFEKDGHLYPGPGGNMSTPAQTTEVTEILKEMRAASDPLKTVELIDKIRGNGQNDGITAVMEMMRDDRATARAELAELRKDNARLMEKILDLQNKPQTPAKTLLEQIDDVQQAHAKL